MATGRERPASTRHGEATAVFVSVQVADTSPGGSCENADSEALWELRYFLNDDDY